METTPAHKAIFDAVASGDRNIIISAVAGAGKTTTLLRALGLAKGRVAFYAFNKRIAEELQSRAPAHVKCQTLNGLGYGALRRWAERCGRKAPNVDSNKVAGIVEDTIPQNVRPMMAGAVKRLVSLAKANGLLPIGGRYERDARENGWRVEGVCPDALDTWRGFIDDHDIEIHEKVTADDVIMAARQVLDRSMVDVEVIDFDDQLLMPYAFRAPFFINDWTFVDEAQDLSPLQHELVAASMGKGGRLAAVGDPHQAIYGFRGADSNSMANMRERFNCVELPLHVSYRCPREVVAEAQTVVHHIQPHASAPAGIIDRTNGLSTAYAFRAGDMVVSRYTAPLVRVCFDLLRKRIPASVMGRDIGGQAINLVDKLNAVSITDLDNKLDAWEQKETAKAIKKPNHEAKVQRIEDRAELIRVVMDGCQTIAELKDVMVRLFTDTRDNNRVTLCTVHRAKGLEADRVIILNRHLMPDRRAEQEWQKEQERNLLYVAITRAKRELVFVSTPRRPTRRASAE